jgi:hypothetical protein
MSLISTPAERAAELRRWLDEKPEDAVKVIDAGLAYLAMHGVDPLGPPLFPVQWGKTEEQG